MIWTAFILGFAGSLHCMGMCSPLLMSVTSRSAKVITARLLYNLGRIVTYGIMGSFVASVGFVIPLVRYQNLLSIILGIALLVIGVTGLSAIKIPFVSDLLERFSLLLKKLFSKFLQKRSNTSTFILGSLNGVLPCGLSFLALTYCLTLARPIDGFTFMMLFGVGTLPVMLGFTSIFYWIMRKFSFNMKRLTTGMLIVSGLLLISRVFFVHAGHEHAFQTTGMDIVICK
jgi:sulfite exporter TauE/SafE